MYRDIKYKTLSTIVTNLLFVSVKTKDKISHKMQKLEVKRLKTTCLNNCWKFCVFHIKINHLNHSIWNFIINILVYFLNLQQNFLFFRALQLKNIKFSGAILKMKIKQYYTEDEFDLWNKTPSSRILRYNLSKIK